MITFNMTKQNTWILIMIQRCFDYLLFIFNKQLYILSIATKKIVHYIYDTEIKFVEK